MKNLIYIIIFLLAPTYSIAGYQYNSTCYDSLDNAYKAIVSSASYIPQKYSSTEFVQIGTSPISLFNSITYVPPYTCTTTTNKPYCLTGPFNAANLNNSSYYLLRIGFRFLTYDINTGNLLNSSSWFNRNMMIFECDHNTTPFGFEPVNITMNPPPGYDAFLNPSIDWATTEWIFGSGLVLFALGAGIGSVINITKKARV